MSGQRDYSPMSALKALVDTAERNSPKIMSSNVPGLVDARGEALPVINAPPRIEGMVIPIAMIMHNPQALPDDFADMPPTREGLKAHVRPDGGTYLGVFGSSENDAVVVYGDPGMTAEETQSIVAQFWHYHVTREAAEAAGTPVPSVSALVS